MLVVQARGINGYKPWKFLAFTLTLCSLFFLVGNGWALDADDIIKRVEDNLNGKTAFMKITMKVKTARSERTIKMESWSIGKEKSFIKINYPLKDKGITFLKIDNAMWQYVPRIEKIIKIPSSMMMQSWMGSDFTHDDLVKESSISDDYHKKILAANESIYEIELLPLEDAPVVWGRIVMEVSKEHFLPVKVRYFDEDGVEVRILHYLDVKHFGDRMYPSRWLMQPLDERKAGHQTIVEISDALFDREISESYFTKRALKRYSM
ncbi:MAG: outer membrane lipoprotein-sorting protein [Thermodesulfobacteriota bacterium]|nr:outer membrane lipoprotein-sorting protein [Thermodesulfobacteriota bacterium]